MSEFGHFFFAFHGRGNELVKRHVDSFENRIFGSGKNGVRPGERFYSG